MGMDPRILGLGKGKLRSKLCRAKNLQFKGAYKKLSIFWVASIEWSTNGLPNP